jgi:DNA-binding transcriptional MerR regulator
MSGTPVDVLALKLPEVTIRRLKEAGIKTVEMLASMEPEELCRVTGYRSPGWCVEVVSTARRYMELLELAKQGESSTPTPLIQLIERLFGKPLFILTTSELVSALRANFKAYCIELYMRSLPHDVLKPIIERCYSSEDERRKNLEEVAKILKQRLGGLVQVQGIDSSISYQLQQESSSQRLVKIYELVMRLPSKYLVQQSKYVKTETGGVAEQRVWEGLAQPVASRLEGIRRTAYDKIKQLGSFVHVKEFEKWIAVTDKAVKDAEEVSKWVREELSKLPLKQLRPDIDIDKIYTVKAIPVYLEPEDAKLLLDTAIAELEEAREELERKIQEAEQEKKRSTIKKLEQELEYTKQVLEQFKKFLQQIEQIQAATSMQGS